MSLLILITFYIINFPSFIKTKNCKTIDDILVNSCSEGHYYNSMTCMCEECSSGLINENICYSDSPRSIYGLENENELLCFYENGTQVHYCANFCPSYYVTELDNEGRWLGYLMCTKGAYPVPVEKPDDTQYQLYTLSNENKQASEINSQAIPISPNYNPDFVDYYNNSCLNGNYEKSCQYLANLCVLSLYYYRNKFCQSIDVLSNNLKRKEIISDHLLKFDRSTESILDKIIDIETSFDSKDNKIHINVIDLYIAK